MRDLLYILGTFGFFGLMLGYVSFCARLGAPDGNSLGDGRP